MFLVVWRQLEPVKREVRRESFGSLADATSEAQTFGLTVPGSVEAVVYDADGNVVDRRVRSNN